MEIGNLDPNRQHKEARSQKQQAAPEISFGKVFESKLAEQVQRVNPQADIKKTKLRRKEIETFYLPEDKPEESVPKIMNDLKKVLKTLIELERRFLGF